MKKRNCCFVTVALILFSSVLTAGQLPQTTDDGLTLVEPASVDAFYWLEGTAAGKYKKIRLLDCYVAFEKNWKRDFNRRALTTSERVDDRDMEQIKARLAADFRETLVDAVGKAGYEMVEETGADVLLVRPAIINLEVTSPNLDNTSRTLSVASSTGSMTLLMELYDSATSTKIGMVMDADSSRDISSAPVEDGTRNRMEWYVIINKWSSFLVSVLKGTQTDRN